MTFKKTSGKYLFNVGKKFIQKISGQGKTTGTGAINRMPPNVPITKSEKLTSQHKINMAQIPGKVFHKYKNIGKMADSMNREGRKMKQYLRGEKETYSGVSKGMNLKTKKKDK